MYNRCYSKAFQESHPWYKGCTVCDEWLDPEHGLGRFAKWCNENYYIVEGEGTTQLDKDILIPGNKIYSPDTCIFVPKQSSINFGTMKPNFLYTIIKSLSAKLSLWVVLFVSILFAATFSLMFSY